MPRGVKKGVSTKKFDRCVTKVKSKSGKKVNPYAVCNASMSGYGMNGIDLKNISAIPFGFFLVLATMAIIAVGLILFFIRKRWIVVRSENSEYSSIAH
ncbi:MAG: hypothetical protein E6K94_09755 [Thaumarchaeota archaeon]|nr:MAG: hypothetical protein E6K94_09755 [Nitrososphaerota archaeon]